MGVEDDTALSSRQSHHMTLLPALAFGFVLGVRHATDADHLAAVGTIAAGRNAGPAWRSALVGAWWGAGHSLSVLLVGGALVLLRTPMPPRVALALEFGVAIMLVGLGVATLIRRTQQSGASALRPFLVGTMHGLAGSAVLALLLIGSTDSATVAAAYLVCFCVGTVAGMAVVSALMTIPARLRPGLVFGHRVRVAAGVASVIVGLTIAHRVGVREGLFAVTPLLP
jgi:high-affinity nickel-transport protein